MSPHVSSTCAHHHTYRCDDTRGCETQFWPPDDEHTCSKHVEAWNKLIVKQKFCVSSWLIIEINKNFMFGKMFKFQKYSNCRETCGYIRQVRILFFYVLLTVYLSLFISVINQLDTQNFCFTISLFRASICFEHMCSSSGGQNCITQPLVPSHI